MSPRVLLIEDDPDVALVSEMTLRSAGFEVDVAGSVAEAMAACERSAPDVALVDLQLPGPSGWEFVREVKQQHRWPGVRIAVYTVHYDETEFMGPSERYPVDAYLHKDGDPADLIASVRKLLATPV